MKVILLKTVPKLGKTNDIIDVPDGYALNALFPKKLAVVATPAAIAALNQRTQAKITEKEIQHNLLDRAIAAITENGTELTYKAKANDKGSLFSRVSPADISKALLAQYRISIDVKHMTIEDIKQTGTYTVKVSDGAYSTSFPLKVVGE